MLHPNPCHGEAAHATADEGVSSSARRLLRFRYTRRPVKIVVRATTEGGRGIADGGHGGAFVIEAELLQPNAVRDDGHGDGTTVCVFMHPASVMNMLPFPATLARAGVPVLTAHSRYCNFDFNLVMEHCVADLGAVVAHCKESLGFDRVVLCGWSGGGSLATYFQSEAERPELGLGLTPADALVCIAAHAGRARILTECLDPTVYLLARGSHPEEEARLTTEFDLFSGNSDNNNSNSRAIASSSPDFLRRYRAAQVARNRRITAWCRQHPGQSFVVHGTMADPRWVDPAVDPNDRTQPFDCYLGDPRVANDAPTGLARFSSSASWLSQWSLEASRGDGVAHMRNVSVPTLIVENGADNGVPPTHVREMYAAAAARDKSYYRVAGATHYYSNQKAKLAEAVGTVVAWLEARAFVSVGSAPAAGSAVDVVKASPSLTVAELRTRYDGTDAMDITGFNHLALVSSDMERTCRFYGGVLGFRLSKTIALPGGGQHFFFEFSGPSGNATDGAGRPQSMAFFWFPDAPAAAPGVSAPSLRQLMETGRHPSAQGSMNHVAFNVPEAKLREYRKRLLASGLSPFVSPVVFHADTEAGVALHRDDPRVTWASVYFFDPDGALLEISSQVCAPAADRARHVSVLPRKALWREGGVRRRSKL